MEIKSSIETSTISTQDASQSLSAGGGWGKICGHYFRCAFSVSSSDGSFANTLCATQRCLVQGQVLTFESQLDKAARLFAASLGQSRPLRT